MEKLLEEFVSYDEKTKSVVVEQIIDKYEKFFVALQYANIPDTPITPMYNVNETVSQIEERPDDVSDILTKCVSKKFLGNLKELANVKHPILNTYRFVKSRDLNQIHNLSEFSAFVYPKCRMWLFFKYQILWCMIKNKDIEKKIKVRNFFHDQFRHHLTENLYVLEVCFETRRADEVTVYHLLDVYDFDGQSFVTKSFEDRYKFLQTLDVFNVLPRAMVIGETDKYLMKRNTDNAYNRTESTLILSRLKMDTYHLLVGETYHNNQTKVYVAKLDPIYNKFNIIGCTSKNKTMLPNKLDFTDKGVCVFGSEYTWKCTPAVNINYYKNPIAAKLMIMSNKLNMRSSIKEVLNTAPIDRSMYIKY
jgi:hypothetical protein